MQCRTSRKRWSCAGAGLSQPVLILGYTPPQLAGELARHRISQTVFSTSYGEALSKGAVEAGVAVNIHIKIDTGMSRLGFFCQQEDCAASIDEAAQVCTLPGLVPEGIFTHFAVSDEGEEGEAFTQHQFEQFAGRVDALREKGHPVSLPPLLQQRRGALYPR